MTTIARVLVVDDDTSVARLLARLIETRPYTCVVAHSAEEALGILEEAAEPYDVVVCDECMPGARGTDFLAFVRGRWPTTRSILLTGHATVETALRAVNRGQVLRILTKPCSADVLLEAIEVAVGAPQARPSRATACPATEAHAANDFSSLQEHLQSLAS
ncbi:MAG: response regulator [Planctomycetota bacterium]